MQGNQKEAHLLDAVLSLSCSVLGLVLQWWRRETEKDPESGEPQLSTAVHVPS
jgi:hypothetical protein